METAQCRLGIDTLIANILVAFLLLHMPSVHLEIDDGDVNAVFFRSSK